MSHQQLEERWALRKEESQTMRWCPSLRIESTAGFMSQALTEHHHRGKKEQVVSRRAKENWLRLVA
jgi:hypothetical protein